MADKDQATQDNATTDAQGIDQVPVSAADTDSTNPSQAELTIAGAQTDAVSRQTAVADIIRDVESAGAKATSWLQGQADVGMIVDHLNAVREELGKVIGLSLDDDGNLVNPNQPSQTDEAASQPH